MFSDRKYAESCSSVYVGIDLETFPRENPCLHCGACCAYYRVSFYWAEADKDQGGVVPLELTEELTGFRRCMQGTNQKQPWCLALKGEIGGTVRCTIYLRRPTPCREYGVKWEHGILRASPDELERCNQARAAWGMPSLSWSAARHRRSNILSLICRQDRHPAPPEVYW